MRSALLIGINYIGTGNALAGCINDVKSMQELLSSIGYQCTVMTDELPRTSTLFPNRANILSEMNSFVRRASPNDKLFLHYSGHGTSVPDRSNDEDDRMDEAICPAVGANILDDELRTTLIDQLPPLVSLTILLDCCHSGTGIDLRYNYEDTSQLLKLRRIPDEYNANDWRNRINRRMSQQYKETQGVVICISGCRDSQTSADTVFNDKPCGAMTEAFLRAYKSLKDPKHQAELRSVMQYMTCMLRCYRYSQVPQLSLSKGESDSLYAIKKFFIRL
jgi:hypothetical protein|uniref:Peptidase C14 caspase domain-containing protein n=1 Tax=viral metagenome TaxID=1070528 RepID=A0A6C0IUU3_9ZZZZ